MQQGRYYGFSNFPNYLTMLARLEIPIFLVTDRGILKERIHILTETQQIKAALTRDMVRRTLEKLYKQFSRRFQMLERAASGIGWGYGDAISEMVGDLKGRMGDE